MKEVMAFIRVNKVEETIKALELNGIYTYTCCKCMGRGKNALSHAGESLFLATDKVSLNPEGGLQKNTRLIAKRYLSILVNDDDVSKTVNILIKVNQTGNPGDGKIFVKKINEARLMRTGEISDSI